MLKLEVLNKPLISHAFFTRNGGASEGLYGSLNCGFGSGDNKQAVEANRVTAMKNLGLPPAALYTCHQHHSNNVFFIDGRSCNTISPKADALVTITPSIALGILTADCGPVLFADHRAKVIGAAHAGWRGALNGILENTIKKMCDYGANLSDISAGIGPMIGPKSYEVGPEFPGAFLSQSKKNERFFSSSRRAGYYLFDLQGYIQNRLELNGIREIGSLERDTYPDKENFFSYRRACHQNERDYGRLLSTIVLQ